MLNCEHAIAQCRRAGGERWLLHVDSDELLYLPDAAPELDAWTARGANEPSGRPGALQRHLATLDRIGALLFTYRNLEAVPEQLECDDPYRQVSLFKQHPGELNEAQPAVAAATRYWRDAPEAGGELFRFYANGKSIVRTDAPLIQTAGSVHEWDLPSKEVAAAAAFTNNRHLRGSQYVYHQLMRHEEAGGALLLHFAVCSFETFWKKRWAALGYASPNHRFRGGGGGVDQRANVLALGARRTEAEAFYRRSMMLPSAVELERQLSAGVCIRMQTPPLMELARQAILPKAAAVDVNISGALPIRSSAPPMTPVTPAMTVPAALVPSSAVAAVQGTVPSWLDAASVAAVDATAQAVRTAALAAVAADEVMVEFTQQALSEAAHRAHTMAAEALEAASSPDGLAALVDRLGKTSLPGVRAPLQASASNTTRSHLYSALFEALLPRVACGTLHLLPLPRLRFDLAAYWPSPAANAVLGDADVASLLRRGVLLLPEAFPAALVAQAALEAEQLQREGTLLPTSTTHAHEDACWLLSDEAPPRVPDPDPPGPPLPPHLFGGMRAIRSAELPALCAAMRGMRSVAARLEEISELRLATPRAARLHEYGAGGSQPRGPINAGWPDMGVEVCCTLFLGATNQPLGSVPAELSITSHGGQRKLSAPAGALLLTLARQAVCHVQATSAEDSAARPRWLTMPAYSSTLRSAADSRMLGFSQAKMREMLELKSRGLLHGQQSQR